MGVFLCTDTCQDYWGGGGTWVAQMDQVTPVSLPPLVLPVPFRLFPPPVSQHLCALEVPGKFPVWPLAQKQAPESGGGSAACSSSVCWLL